MVTQDARKFVAMQVHQYGAVDKTRNLHILHNDATPLEAACVIFLLCRGSRRPFAYHRSTD